jgi:undecaprenyl-phosphate 4-deoxy-4-formamido-L-arabinose transferase
MNDSEPTTAKPTTVKPTTVKQAMPEESTTRSTAEVEVSVVIPVYNGGDSIARVVRDVHDSFGDLEFEIVLVNDSSKDNSEAVCSQLAEDRQNRVKFLHLARNFGEHNAVLAGLRHTSGQSVVVLDDDGQNPPSEARKLYEELNAKNLDVVYGRHGGQYDRWYRGVGSWLNDRVANVMLKKPPGLYLSSFKAMNRFLVNQIVRYSGAFPYIDGLVLQTTSNIGQLEVEHRPRQEGRSGYTMRKLIRLWLNMFVNYSILPLRLSVALGLFTSMISVVLLAVVVIDKVWVNPTVTVGIPSVLLTVALFSGVQLLVLGMVGEYLGRLFLDHSMAPQFVIRYVKVPSEVKEPNAMATDVSTPDMQRPLPESSE